MEKIYADYKLDNTKDMFVFTPEGNEFEFPFEDGYNDKHAPVTIIDPSSNKNYLVVFDE